MPLQIILGLYYNPSKYERKQKFSQTKILSMKTINAKSGKKVVVIGELNVDAMMTGLARAPQMGGETIAADFALKLGSASAIFACGVAKLGHDVMFISKVGRDDFGDFCLAALRDEGISTRHVNRDQTEKTGITIALSTPRDRALVTYLGAISSLRAKDINMSLLRSADHLHMTSYFLQDNLRASFSEILRRARSMKLTTSFDPNSDPTGKWRREIWDVIAESDVLFLNETEARALTRRRQTKAVLAALGRNVRCAVIKLGARGAIAICDGKIYQAPAISVRAVDTTGAGDSFAAGFVSTYIRKKPIEECLLVGNACGALSTLKAGGTAGQPDQTTLAKFLARAKDKSGDDSI